MKPMLLSQPDSTSNIRRARIVADQVRFERPVNCSLIYQGLPKSTTEQDAFDKELLAAVAFNHEYWSYNNTMFEQARVEFAEKIKEKHGRDMTEDEKHVFHKEYLNASYSTHANYNRRWWKRNFALLVTGYSIQLRRLGRWIGLERGKSRALPLESSIPAWQTFGDSSTEHSRTKI